MDTPIRSRTTFNYGREELWTTRAKPWYTQTEIRDRVIESKIVPSISRSTVQRILASAELRPHLTDGWVHSPDPCFREKVNEITERFLHPPPH